MNLPPRLAAVVLPVYAAGLASAIAAAVSFAASPRSAGALAGIAGLLVAAVLADRYPVPLDGIDTGGVSLLFVFLVATVVLFGWEAGVLVAVVAALMQMTQHRPPMPSARTGARTARCSTASRPRTTSSSSRRRRG